MQAPLTRPAPPSSSSDIGTADDNHKLNEFDAGLSASAECDDDEPDIDRLNEEIENYGASNPKITQQLADLKRKLSWDSIGDYSWMDKKKMRFDSFLADLDELSDYEDDQDNDNADIDAADIEEEEEEEEEEALNNYDDLDCVSKLQKSQRFSDIMLKVENALEKGYENSSRPIVLEKDDPEYQLIVDSNALLIDIDNEIVNIHNFIRDKYQLKFPELESLINHPIDYARVVKKIANEVDLTLVDLQSLLPSAMIMVVSVTASTSSGKPLPEHVLQNTIDACERALALDSAKQKVLHFVESRMRYIAPNLSAIVGSVVAAKLVGTVGGLSALAEVRNNIQFLGAKRNNLAGFSTATSQFRVGYVQQTEIFQGTPPSLRMRACRLLCAKSALAICVDCTGADPAGKTGASYRAEIQKKIEKWQEPPPAKQPKPLSVPDYSKSKKKRGGQRSRNKKQAYAPTDMHQMANRVQFGIPEESSLGDGIGQGYGMLGQAGSGKLRVSVGQSRLATKVANKLKGRDYGTSGATSGLTSSLSFTPFQGLELSNPQADQFCGATQSTYFSEIAAFSKIKRT